MSNDISKIMIENKTLLFSLGNAVMTREIYKEALKKCDYYEAKEALRHGAEFDKNFSDCTECADGSKHGGTDKCKGCEVVFYRNFRAK